MWWSTFVCVCFLPFRVKDACCAYCPALCFLQLTVYRVHRAASQQKELLLILASGSVLLVIWKSQSSLCLCPLLGRFHTCARYSPARSEVLCTECFTSVLAHLGVEPRRWIARSECACISSVAKYCQILLPEYVPFFLPLPKIEYVVRISGFYRFDCWEMAFYHYLYLKSFYHGWDCSSFFYVWVIFASFLSCLLSF